MPDLIVAKKVFELPGYWDAIIGPGKPLDTDRCFVVSSDTLVNLNTKDPNTVTTGPASIDPDSGVPYAMRFPVVTIRGCVEVRRPFSTASVSDRCTRWPGRRWAPCKRSSGPARIRAW